MANLIEYSTIDNTLFAVAILVNIFCIGIMLSRVKKLNKVETFLGILTITLIFPTTAAVILNYLTDREWWTYILPAWLILFFIIELILDYILKLDFRNARLLWPYLAVFYISLNGMIGYSFLMSKTNGFIMLSFYFLNLLAQWYSYSKVGHGD